jgi:hypothetical protein
LVSPVSRRSERRPTGETKYEVDGDAVNEVRRDQFALQFCIMGHAVGQRAEYWTLAADEEEREQAMLQHGRWLEEIGAMQEDEEAEALVRGQSVQAMRDDKTRDVKA